MLGLLWTSQVIETDPMSRPESLHPGTYSKVLSSKVVAV